MNVYVGGEDVRTREGLDTPVAEGETVILLPAVAGGLSNAHLPLISHSPACCKAAPCVVLSRARSLRLRALPAS